MKSRIWTVLFAGVFVALAADVGWAQNEQTENTFPNYTVINLGSLTGDSATAFGINNLGWMGGTSYLAGNVDQRAVLWLPGTTIDLGTFGGPNSASQYAPNELGQATGWAETSLADPLGEDFCGFGTHLQCFGFLWQLGIKVPLPTLGGDNSMGLDINNSGQVVGEAETAFHDPTCVAPQVLQTLAAVWENGHVRALPTFGGAPDGGAIANNDNGQVVGYAANCGTPGPEYALLWENGKVINLGSLGGVTGNLPEDINDLGEVVGYSDLPGDTTSHAFLWRNGKMNDLGTLAGDVSDISSTAYAINNHGQVVGNSCGGANGNCPAFLWQNGTMTDLNSLIPADSPLYLLEPYDINDSGEIVGQAYDASTGEYPAFLAIPVRGTAVSPNAQLKLVPKVTLQDNARELLAQRHRGRLRFARTTPQ